MRHKSPDRLKAVLPYIFGLACVAFAAVAGRQAGRVLVIVLLMVCWVALFALQRQGESRGASPGMRGPI